MNEKMTDQLVKFNQLWKETRDLWPPPGFSRNINSGTRLDWNIIAIPPAESWKSLTPIIEVVGEQWPWNIPYTIPQLHITIAGLSNTVDWAAREKDLKSILTDITAEQGPIKLSLHGINILRNTIIVQTIDLDGSLRKLVGQFAKHIREKKIVRNFRVGVHSELWWASIIRLYKPIPDDILALVANFRDTDFGLIIIDSIELCQNNKTFDSKKTLQTIKLKG
jgi:2'-5' RNA ligase